MRRLVVILPRADADVDDCAAYIAQGSEAAAARFMDAAFATFEAIGNRPGIGRPRAFERAELRGMRSAPIRGFRRYLAFYLHDAATLTIVRVIHGARDLPAIFGEAED